MRLNWHNTVALLSAPVSIAVAGCGGRVSASGVSAASGLSIQASVSRIDTNRTARYSATLANGEPANVEWSVSGGDPRAGAGTISRDGVYTPPSYLTRDAMTVEVSAALAGSQGNSASDSAQLTVTPGFLQPLTPGNLALGANGTATISGSMTEVGGSGGIHFTLASDPSGTSSTAGNLSAPHCVRGAVDGANPAYTVCSVTYTAPTAIAATDSIYILGSIGLGSIAAEGASSPTVSWTRVLLNPAGIGSNPVSHQARLAVPVQLGSSSGSNVDYDSNSGQLTDCCGGTLGSLLQDSSGNQYVLSNDHVFARSDQAIPGETIIQPGLIDNGCTPYGVGPGTNPVATLTGYPSLSSPLTNVDAAIARVTPGLVDSKGNILELGAKQPDGMLAAAPPGISSSGGRGESASLGMMVAKSGRTTGLTCAAVSAIDVDVVVDYFTDCAETARAMSKTFTNQIAVAGTSFSDAGDSGALVVDSTNAEPVGLFFAGGTDTNGVEHAIASPVADVLTTLDSQVSGVGGQTAYSFVGGADHPVSCLSYDTPKPAVDPSVAVRALSAAERERMEAALPQAQLLLNPASGLTRIGLTASKDRPGAGAIAFYAEPAAYAQTAIPAAIGGVPTVLIAASASQNASQNASLNASQNIAQPEPSPIPAAPRAASLALAIAAKQRNAASLMKANPAIFGVGVGQSLDDPGDAAVILYVDRRQPAGNLPETLDGQRVRVLLMDRLHVTRAHGSGSAARSAVGCSARRTSLDPLSGNPAGYSLFRRTSATPGVIQGRSARLAYCE